MAHAHVERRHDKTGDVELLERHLAALFGLGLVFAVLGTRARLYLIGRAYAASLELNFDSKYPFTGQFVVAREHEARNRNLVVFDFCVALGGAGKAIQAVILEAGQHLAIAADAVFAECGILGSRWLGGKRGGGEAQARQQRDGQSLV